MKSKLSLKIGCFMVGFFVLLSFTGNAQADDWTQMAGNVATISNGFNNIVYGDGTYVSTSVSVSNNTPSPGNFRFIARVFTSPDLANWTEQAHLMTWSHAGTAGTNGLVLNFWNNTFVAAAYCSDVSGTVATSGIYTSTDGVTWSRKYTGTDSSMSLGYGNNTFFAPALMRSYDASSNTTLLTYKIHSSADGNTWTERYSNTMASSGSLFNLNLNTVSFWYNTYVTWYNITNSSSFPSTTSKLLFSSDGITWTERYTGTGALGFARLRNTLAIGLMTLNQGSGGPDTATFEIYTSDDDGYKWTKRSAGGTFPYTSTTSMNLASDSNGAFFAWIGINNAPTYTVKTLYSTDGSSWSTTDQNFTGTGNFWSGYVRNSFFGARIYVNNAGTSTVKILSFPVGDTWIETYSNTFATPVSLSLGFWNSTFIAFGNDGNGHAIVLKYTKPITIWYSNTVRDSDANPIGGATVSVAENSSITTTTSVDGGFTLREIVAGSPYTAKMVKVGYWPTYSMPSIFLPPNPYDFTRSVAGSATQWLYRNDQLASWGAQPNKGVLAFRTVDGFSGHSGNIAGVTVTAAGAPSGKTYPVTYRDTSDTIDPSANATYMRGGALVLNVEDGDTVTLNASKAGWSFPLQSFEVYGGGVTIGSVYGTPTGATTYLVSGIVKDPSTNLPIADAFVSITDVDTGTEVARARANEAGYYLERLLSPGQYSVSASRTGYDSMSPPYPVVLSDVSPNVMVNLLMSPAEPTPFGLSTGWNFISFSKAPPADVSTALADVYAHVATVWGWDGQNQAWKRWKPSGGASNTLSSLEAGKGYWIYADASGAINMSAWTSPPSATVHLYDGWNLIGYLGSDHTDVSYALGNTPVTWLIAWGWEGNQWYGKHSTITSLPAPIQPLVTMSQNKAYWIKVKPGRSTDWTAPTLTYSNASLAEVWLTAGGPNEDIYFMTDGAGSITDYGGFYAAGGSYQVQPGGSFTATFNTQGHGSSSVTGVMTSPVTWIGTGSWTATGAKVVNTGACAGTWSGTLTQTAGSVTNPIVLTVDQTGTVSSFTGLGTTATGKMFCQADKVVAHLITGLSNSYYQITLNGLRTGNSISGAFWIDNPSPPGGDGTFTLTTP